MREAMALMKLYTADQHTFYSDNGGCIHLSYQIRLTCSPRGSGSKGRVSGFTALAKGRGSPAHMGQDQGVEDASYLVR